MSNRLHEMSRFAGFRDPILANQNARIIASAYQTLGMTGNAGSMRTVFGRNMGGGSLEPDPRSDVAEECGWPESPSADLFAWLYLTDTVSARVDEFMPRECGQVQPELYENEAGEETPFTDSIKALSDTLRGGDENWFEPEKGGQFFSDLVWADVVTGIGSYGGVYLVLDDGVDPSKPVAGFAEQGSRPAAKDEKAKERLVPANGNGTANVRYKLTRNAEEVKGRRLEEMLPLAETLCRVVAWETNSKSKRNGWPVLYQVTTVDPNQSWSSNVPSINHQYVHWTRIVHMVDSWGHPQLGGRVVGNPRKRCALPELLDGRKISGANGVANWRNAFLKLFLETHPQLGGDVMYNKGHVQDEFENMMTMIGQQWMVLKGMHANPVAPAVVDPSPHQKAKMERICIKYGWPVRIFMGSERGELASSQDEIAHKERVAERQRNYVGPHVIAPVVNRLIMAGVLEPPTEKYKIHWPEIGEQDPLKKSQVFSITMQGLAAAEQVTLLSDKGKLVEAGWTEEEAEAELDEAEKDIVAKEEDLAAQGLKPEAPEGFVDPEQQKLDHEVELERAKSGGGGAPPFGGKKPFGKKPAFAANQDWWAAMEQSRNHGDHDQQSHAGGGGGKGVKTRPPSATVLKEHIERSVKEDYSNDDAQELSDHFSDVPKTDLLGMLREAGIKEASASDSKGALLKRLRNEVTAGRRTRERNAV